MKRLLARAGVAGFAFFAIKGCVWLAVGLVAYLNLA